MPFGESLLIALFLLTIVFIVLLGLFGCIRLFSFATAKIPSVKRSIPFSQTSNETNVEIPAPTDTDEVKLIETDEPTAAMIMAIVSDASGITLNELYFKSIKRLDADNQ